MGSKSAIGIGNGICFKQVRDKGRGSYIDPLVRDSLVGVWIADQNTNESPTRNIIKNTIKDKGGDLELLNFGYKLNSGYGKYEEDFTDWGKVNPIDSISSDSFYAVNIAPNLRTMLVRNHNTGDEMPQWKVMVSGLKGEIIYILRTESGNVRHQKLSEGINILEKSYAYDGDDIVGFAFHPHASATITQIPSFEGALVTDGIDDLITSTKTVQEMLGGSNEITVVSMMLNLENEKITYTNQIRPFQNGYIRNNVISNTEGKYGIYGYKITDITDIFKNRISINDILGDREDYDVDAGGTARIDGKFSVEGYCLNDGTIGDVSQVAWYWTIIAKIALTTDQINQVISYFNLDKHVKPEVYYNVKKQGLSNDTPKADWYLKDFSRNGHDMQLYNYAKSKDSGIGKYAEDFLTWSSVRGIVKTSSKIEITEGFNNNQVIDKRSKEYSINSFKVSIKGIPEDGYIELLYFESEDAPRELVMPIYKDGDYFLPNSTLNSHNGLVGFRVSSKTSSFNPQSFIGLTVEQIPDYEGALVSDGKDDYGKAEGLPIFKDYTVVADRAIVDDLITNADGGVFSKSTTVEDGAFIFDCKDQIFSFGTENNKEVNTNRFISYQSKYINNGKSISAGSMADVNHLLLAKLALESNRYSALALYSMLLFPYSLSEFLLERQLKKYRLGTLYPGMIEWRPIAKSNIPYKQIDYFIKRSGTYVRLNPGDYFQSTEDIIVRVTSIRDSQLDVVSSIKVNGKNEVISVNSSYAQTAPIHIDKSPQKIDITIDEYIRYEDIVQPYPAIINLKQDGKTITWGDKLKVGSDIVFVGSANLLPELYTVSKTRYNGVTLYPNTIIKVEKSMVFDNARTYLKANEPNCILSPNRLRIPNSSYKILGYIPDLTGKGNHGRLNNFAYTEESGANEDGSIRFDGTDDYIIIPTIKHGGQALLMKVNWRYKNIIAMVYDQRINWIGFGISISRDQLPVVAYKPYNKVTYIDGIKNESVLVQDLEGITHNIIGTYDNLDLSDERDVCISRTSKVPNSGFADMSMYEFMLFPDVPNEEEIQELNDIVGIEGGYVESPNYYWDAYGKKNTDTDRNAKEPV